MTSDDLTRPLEGKGRGKAARKPLPGSVRLVALLCVAVIAVFGGWIVAVDDPLGGEPAATASIVRRAAPSAEPGRTPPPAQGIAVSTPPQGQGTIAARPGGDSGGIVIRPVGPDDADAPRPSGGPVVIRVPGAGGGSGAGTGVRDPDRRLIEEVGGLAIPRIGSDGLRPSSAYARQTAGMLDPRPKVAVLVGGLGVSGNITSEAIAKLPADITLGFAPYGVDLDRWASRARGDGHEYVLQLPMEPFDYPNNDPGPQTLLSSEPDAVNLERLRWLMGRMQGYVGVSNFMGARFTSSESSLSPILTEIGRRGLIFIDDGASPRSLVTRLAEPLGLTAARAHVVIDDAQTPADIDAALARLEELARRDGMALGVGSALPVTIERLAEWSRTLGDKGLILVPVSALAKHDKPS